MANKGEIRVQATRVNCLGMVKVRYEVRENQVGSLD